MTKLSKLHLDPQEMGNYINNLWSAFVLLISKEEIRELFRDLFSHTEYKMFAKRLETARRLLQGQSYDEIKKSLKVTSNTVAHINNILADRGDGYRKVHERLSELEKSYQRKKERRQSYLERRQRKKLPAETLIFDVVKATGGALDKAIIRKRKVQSAGHKLLV